MQERFKVSVRRSCELALLQRSVWYARSAARDQSALGQRIRDMDQGPDGLLYVLTDERDGALLKLEPAK